MKHPQGTYVLIFTQMWERFSFYGMRTLLALFLIQELKLENIEAISMYSLFITLVNLGGLAGGYYADRVLGLKPAIFLGGGLIAFGHLCLMMQKPFIMVLLALSLIIVGTSLFSTNVKALIGQLYGENDPRRDSGYTLFYAGINLGGFLAAISCGYAAHIFGWHYGFGLAFLGMLAGLSVLFYHKKLIKVSNEEKLDKKNQKVPPLIQICSIFFIIVLCTIILQSHHVFLFVLPIIGCFCALHLVYSMRKDEAFTKILCLCCFIAFYIIFFMIEALMGSFFMIFCENNVNRSIWGVEIPSSTLVAMNPLTVIIFGTCLSMFQRKVTEGKYVLKMNSIAFMLLAIAFGVLYSGVQQGELVGIFFVLFCFALIALGELCIAPSLYSFCSLISPSTLKGQLMSLVIFGRAIASFFSGILGKSIVSSSQSEIYLFEIVAALAMGLSIVLAITYQRIKRKSRYHFLS